MALVLAALHFLAELCHLGGPQFMLRRLQTEAWPIMLQLMKQGTCQQQHTLGTYSPGRHFKLPQWHLQSVWLVHVRGHDMPCITRHCPAPPSVCWQAVSVVTISMHPLHATMLGVAKGANKVYAGHHASMSQSSVVLTLPPNGSANYMCTQLPATGAVHGCVVLYS